MRVVDFPSESLGQVHLCADRLCKEVLSATPAKARLEVPAGANVFLYAADLRKTASWLSNAAAIGDSAPVDMLCAHAASIEEIDLLSQLHSVSGLAFRTTSQTDLLKGKLDQLSGFKVLWLRLSGWSSIELEALGYLQSLEAAWLILHDGFTSAIRALNTDRLTHLELFCSGPPTEDFFTLPVWQDLEHLQIAFSGRLTADEVSQVEAGVPEIARRFSGHSLWIGQAGSKPLCKISNNA